MSNTTIIQKFDEAEAQQRCAFATNPSETQAFDRRVRKGTIVRVYANMFLPKEVKEALTPGELVLRIARTLQLRHPSWVFTGTTAAAILGLETMYSMHRTVTTISRRRTHETDSAHLHCRQSDDFDVIEVAGMKVTPPARAILEAMPLHEPREVRGMLDSALRQGMITKKDILAELAHVPELFIDDDMYRLLEHANPRCENGGESYTDQTIRELGFMVPAVQVEHINPLTGRPIRGDFEFRDKAGLFVVLELDGQDKYTDPEMTKGLSLPEVVDAERYRQEGFHALGAKVVRSWFDEVRERAPLQEKLISAGVPFRARTWSCTV